MNTRVPTLFPGEVVTGVTPASAAPLTAAEQKQVREALTTRAGLGIRYPGELTDIRVMLQKEFLRLRADNARAAKGKEA